jgi:hypothetical protein
MSRLLGYQSHDADFKVAIRHLQYASHFGCAVSDFWLVRAIGCPSAYGGRPEDVVNRKAVHEMCQRNLRMHVERNPTCDMSLMVVETYRLDKFYPAPPGKKRTPDVFERFFWNSSIFPAEFIQLRRAMMHTKTTTEELLRMNPTYRSRWIKGMIASPFASRNFTSPSAVAHKVSPP